MPLSVYDNFDLPNNPSPIRFALEPVRSALQCLMLLSKCGSMAPVTDWTVNTFQAMSREERRNNDLVMNGLHYVVQPQESWNSFPAYVNFLMEASAEELRDKMLDAYDHCSLRAAPSEKVMSRADALASSDTYLAYLRQRFDPDHIDEQIERQAYKYVIDPPAMQRLIVNHLRLMWEKYLAEEWERVRSMLTETTRAFQKMDLSGKSMIEAARLVTGQELNDAKWEMLFAKARQVTFVPHPHVGPYLLKTLGEDGNLFIFFAAHLPDGLAIDTPELSRTEIFVRLSTLADDTRLRILRSISERGEQRSQEIMEALDLSQSAASRHLAQLSASGFLIERRCDGAKCYSLNTERIADTLQAISSYLLISERIEI